MSTPWWLTILGLAGGFCFAGGYVLRVELERFRRASGYVREIDLTCSSRGFW